MRKNIFEIIAEQDYNLHSEVQTIENLISEHFLSIGNSLEKYVDIYLFRGWEYRDTVISTKAYRKKLDISYDTLRSEKVYFEEFLKFTEYVLNICYLFENKTDLRRETINKITIPIINNIELILNSLNFEIRIEDEVKCKVIIIESNPSATAVAEIIEADDISREVIRYNHFMLKGELIEKEKILLRLYKEFEKIRKKLEANNCRGMASDCGLLFNSLVRHVKADNPEIDARIKALNPEDLEEWYDKTYDLFLTCELVANTIDMKKDIDWLKTGE